MNLLDGKLNIVKNVRTKALQRPERSRPRLGFEILLFRQVSLQMFIDIFPKYPKRRFFKFLPFLHPFCCSFLKDATNSQHVHSEKHYQILMTVHLNSRDCNETNTIKIFFGYFGFHITTLPHRKISFKDALKSVFRLPQ